MKCEALAGLIGLQLDCASDLRNNLGYHDAFQLRFRDDGVREETVQFEVAASAISVSWVRRLSG